MTGAIGVLLGAVPSEVRVRRARNRFAKRLTGLRISTIQEHRLPNPSKLAFGIVHWNAPDYLALNVARLSRLHPDSKAYVLDNGSEPATVEKLAPMLEQYPNVVLLSAEGDSEHAVGLQVLLEHSAAQGDAYLCFLDQDCILARRIDPLLPAFALGTLLIGPRYGSLDMVHPSLMVVQPGALYRAFGHDAFSYLHHFEENSFGISERARGHITFLNMVADGPSPTLTSYEHGGVVYAWHGCYSARTFFMPGDAKLDGMRVSDIRAAR